MSRFNNLNIINQSIKEYFCLLYKNYSKSPLEPELIARELDLLAKYEISRLINIFPKAIEKSRKERILFEVILGLPGSGKSTLNREINNRAIEPSRQISNTGTGGVTKPYKDTEHFKLFGKLSKLIEEIKERSGGKLYYRGEMMNLAFLLDQLRLIVSGADIVVGDVFPRRSNQIDIQNKILQSCLDYSSKKNKVINIQMNRLFVIRCSASELNFLNNESYRVALIETLNILSNQLSLLRRHIESGKVLIKSYKDLSNNIFDTIKNTVNDDDDTILIRMNEIWRDSIISNIESGISMRKVEKRSDDNPRKHLIRLSSDLKYFTEMISRNDFHIKFIGNINSTNPEPMVKQYLEVLDFEYIN